MWVRINLPIFIILVATIQPASAKTARECVDEWVSCDLGCSMLPGNQGGCHTQCIGSKTICDGGVTSEKTSNKKKVRSHPPVSSVSKASALKRSDTVKKATASGSERQQAGSHESTPNSNSSASHSGGNR